MIKFRSEYKAERFPITLNPEQGACLLGSCFTDYVGTKMRESLWNATVNPGGVLFNPISIANYLEMALCKKRGEDNNYKITPGADGGYVSLCFANTLRDTEEACKLECERRVMQLLKAMESSQVLILTFGTAMAYIDRSGRGADYKENVVGNCHKLPSTRFERRRLKVVDVVERYKEIITKLKFEFPYLKVIYTVSPVRHLRDKFQENSVSKATLLLAVNELIEKGIGDAYFPSYEIFIDDLRDYRWVERDLAHPNAEAVEYIWEKFQDSFLNEEGIKLLQAGNKLRQRASHRVLNEESASGREFIECTKKMAAKFAATYPSMLKIY